MTLGSGWGRRLAWAAALGAVTTVAWGAVWFVPLDEDSAPIEGAVGHGSVVWLVDVLEARGRTRVDRRAHDVRWTPILTENWKAHEDRLAETWIDDRVPSWSRTLREDPAAVADGKDPFRMFGREEAAGWPLRALMTEYDDLSLAHLETAERHPAAVKRVAGVLIFPGWKNPSDPVEVPVTRRPVRWGLVARMTPHPGDGPGTHLSMRRYDATVLPLRPIAIGFALNTVFFAVLWVAVLVGPIMVRAERRRRRWRCVACGYNLRGGEGGRCPECGHAGVASPSANAPMEGAGR